MFTGSYADLPRFTSTTEAAFLGTDVLLGLAVRVVRVHASTQRNGRPECAVTLADLARDQEFQTQPIGERVVLRNAREAMQKGTLMMAYGTIVEPARDAPGGKMRIVDLCPLTRPTSMLGPGPGEIQAADAALDRLLAAPGALRAHLLGEIRHLTSANTDTLSDRFLLCEELVLLQALSYAQVASTVNSRLSLYMYSMPGRGKKILGEYARLLAPVSDLLQPSQGSAVGIGASVQLEKGGWVAKPGALPKCSGGVCVLEDLHRLEKKQLNAIQSILMSVAEDGLIMPAKAAAASYSSRCGLLLNANRSAMLSGEDVQAPKGPAGRLAELGLPFDLLSRLDVIVNLTSGDDAVAAAQEMVEQPAQREHQHDETVPTRVDPTEEQKRERALKVLVARVLERIPQVEMEGVVEPMRDLVRKLAVVLREYTASLTGPQQELFEADSLLRRMANSARKLVGAQARLAGRSTAVVADVDRAWELLSPKLEVVKWACSDAERMFALGSQKRQVSQALLASEQRWQQIVARFGGQSGLTAAEIARQVGWNERTVQRELSKRGVLPVLGRYAIPTEEKRAEQEQEHKQEQAQETLEEQVAASVMPLPREHEEEPADEEVKELEWNDGLARLPAEFAQVQAGLNELDRKDAVKVAKNLVDLVVSNCPLDVPLLAQMVSWEVAEMYTGVALPAGKQEELRLALSTRDWEARAQLGLSLYVGAELPDLREMIAPVLEQAQARGMPEGVQVALRATYNRLQFYEERGANPARCLPPGQHPEDVAPGPLILREHWE